MPSWGTLIRQQLATPGERGPNARRIAEGVGLIDGAAIAALGTRGSWWRRLAQAGGLTAGRGGWENRIAPAGSGSALKRIHDAELLASEDPP